MLDGVSISWRGLKRKEVEEIADLILESVMIYTGIIRVPIMSDLEMVNDKAD